MSAPNVIALPRTVMRGRKRVAASVYTGCGDLSLMALARDGEPFPPNVVRLAVASNPSPAADRAGTAMALTLALFTRLAPEQQADISRQFRLMEFENVAGVEGRAVATALRTILSRLSKQEVRP